MKQNINKPKSMHKKDLIPSLSEISGLSKNEVTQALNAFLLVITKSLKDVRLLGFGVFRVLLHPEREGKNPRTGKPVKIPAQKVPKFRPSLMLRNEIA